MDNATGIYRIRNAVSGKAYIGSSVNIYNRFATHKESLVRGKHFNQYLQAAWNKYGADAFLFEVIEFCEMTALIERENFWIYQERATDSAHGYNLRICAQSNLGIKLPPKREETKQKLREANLGKTYSDDVNLRKGSGWLGKKRGPMSEEQKAKISASKRGVKALPRTAEHMANIWAKRRENGTDKHTEEGKRKSGAKNLGKPLSPEHRKNISAALIGKPQPEGHGKKVWETRRANGLAASAYKGIPRSEEVKRKISESKSCLYEAVGFSL